MSPKVPEVGPGWWVPIHKLVGPVAGLRKAYVAAMTKPMAA